MSKSIVIFRESRAQGEENIIRVGAPGEVWRLLRGASPRRVRPNQPPVSSVANAKEVLKQIDATCSDWKRALRDTLNGRTMCSKRTQRILWAVGETALPKAIQPRHINESRWRRSPPIRKPTRRDRYR